MNNYEFCAQWALDQADSKDLRVLDYGCGSGEVVKLLRQKNINAFGCDVFYEGGDYSSQVENNFIEASIIKPMEGNTIPFDDRSFDLVINNQVMEHVENIEGVLNEIQRVLKPTGILLSLFPDKSVWREGHCGIPFLHWFPKNSSTRIYYAATLRLLGFGHHKGEKSATQWSRDFCEWLDKWTYYRTQEEINKAYNIHFCNIEHIESYWLQQRLNKHNFIASLIPRSLKKLIVNKLAGLVFVSYRFNK